MNFFITLDERYVDPLIRQLEQYTDDEEENSIANEDGQFLAEVLNTLYNIKDDLDSPLTDSEVDIMKEKFNDDNK